MIYRYINYLFGSFTLAGLLLSCIKTPPSAEVTPPVVENSIVDQCYLVTEAGQFSDAVVICEKAVSEFPNSFLAHASYAKALIRTNDAQKGEAEYRRALELEPDSVKVRMDFGHYLESIGKRMEALAEFEYVSMIKPDHTEAIVRMAEICKAEQQFNKSYEYYLRALETAPDQQSLYIDAAMAFVDIEVNAKSILEKALHRFPEEISIYTTYASMLLSWKEYDHAIQQLQRAQSIQPGNPDIEFKLSQAQYLNGDYRDAQITLKEYLANHPDSSDAYLLMGRLQSDSLQYEQALLSFQRAVELDDQNGQAYVFLGNTRHKIGDERGAIEAYRQALRINPEDDLAKKNLKRLIGAPRGSSD